MTGGKHTYGGGIEEIWNILVWHNMKVGGITQEWDIIIYRWSKRECNKPNM